MRLPVKNILGSKGVIPAVIALLVVTASVWMWSVKHTSQNVGIFSGGQQNVYSTSSGSATSEVAFSGNFTTVTVHNTGSSTGWFSIDGGTSWAVIEGSVARTINRNPNQTSNISLYLQNLSGGANMSGVYIDAN